MLIRLFHWYIIVPARLSPNTNTLTHSAVVKLNRWTVDTDNLWYVNYFCLFSSSWREIRMRKSRIQRKSNVTGEENNHIISFFYFQFSFSLCFTLFIGFTIIIGCVFSRRHSSQDEICGFFLWSHALLPFALSFILPSSISFFQIHGFIWCILSFHQLLCTSAIKSQAIFYLPCITFWSMSLMHHCPYSLTPPYSDLFGGYLFAVWSVVSIYQNFIILSLSDFCISIYSFPLTPVSRLQVYRFFWIWGGGREEGILYWNLFYGLRFIRYNHMIKQTSRIHIWIV